MKMLWMKYFFKICCNEWVKGHENMNLGISFLFEQKWQYFKSLHQIYCLPEIRKEFRHKWMTIFVTLLSDDTKITGWLTMAIVANLDRSLISLLQIIYKKPAVARNDLFKWIRKGDQSVAEEKTAFCLSSKNTGTVHFFITVHLYIQPSLAGSHNNN